MVLVGLFLFLICSVEGCTPITMPKLARETALIDFGRTVLYLKKIPNYYFYFYYEKLYITYFCQTFKGDVSKHWNVKKFENERANQCGLKNVA